MEKGLAEGEKKKAFEVARRLKSMGLLLGTIVDATGLSEWEVAEIE